MVGASLMHQTVPWEMETSKPWYWCPVGKRMFTRLIIYIRIYIYAMIIYIYNEAHRRSDVMRFELPWFVWSSTPTKGRQLFVILAWWAQKRHDCRSSRCRGSPQFPKSSATCSRCVALVGVLGVGNLFLQKALKARRPNPGESAARTQP